MERNSYLSSYLSHSESFSEEDWPFRVGSDNYSEYKTFGKNFPDLSISKLHAKNVLSFGNYVERHNWIECLSRSIPGKTYYYNLRSGCSTWNRPISRYIHIPRYLRRESSFSDVQCTLRSPSLVVSDDDDDCCSGSSIKLQEKNHQREWILEQLYYNKKKTKKKYQPRIMAKFSNYNGPKSISDSSSSDSMCYNDEYSTSEDDCDESTASNLSNTNTMLPMNVTNFLECNLSECTEFERCVDSRLTKTKLKNIYNSDEDDSDLSSFVDYRRNDKRFVRLVPRLKKIKYRDMLRNNRKKVRIIQKKSTKILENDEIKKEVTQKPEKIICNMYGVTTVNYNYSNEAKPKPKRNINGCNLSDSTSVVSSAVKENRSRSSILKHFGRDDLDKIIPPLILSDTNSSNSSSTSSSSSSLSLSSSSSTSFTCDTCSSTSDTSANSTTS